MALKSLAFSLVQDHPQRDHVGLIGEVIFPNLTLGPRMGGRNHFCRRKKNGGVIIMPGKYGIMDFLKMKTLHKSKSGLCQLLVVFFFGLDVLSDPSTG
jgi:hypothetical protein